MEYAYPTRFARRFGVNHDFKRTPHMNLCGSVENAARYRIAALLMTQSRMLGKPLFPEETERRRTLYPSVRPAFLALILVILFAVLALTQTPTQSRRTPMTASQNAVSLHHPVSTKVVEAQALFDRGLQLIYALDYSGAANSFQRAAALDPNMAMAYWGIAYARGSDYYYHSAGDPGRERAAYDALQNALALSAHGPAVERAYITSLSQRYCDCPNPNREQQAVEFKNAMRDLSQSYPDDLDAATLYAQSIMNLSPWALWTADGTPWEGTPEILSVLESVLKRDPRHVGAVHYYIHALEGSPHPERALPYVKVLPALAPSIGHIVHMPAHVYIRTGDYLAAEAACVKAAQVDENHLQNSGQPDTFTILSYFHDLYFLGAAASMDGHFSIAREAADKLVERVAPHAQHMPPLQSFLNLQTAVLVRFARWDDILKLPPPNVNLRIANTMWHFARGIAFAAIGKIAEGEAERLAVTRGLESTPPDETFAMSPNKTRDILEIAADALAAKLAMARKERTQAIAQLQNAVAIQDRLKYAEPPSWFYPERESLGAALFLDGQVPEAEQVFRQDLQQNPRNPRSLFGLLQALRSSGKAYDAGFVQSQLKNAWKGDLRQLDLRNF
jgi:tetratricopeptide (TPR) repeat protein